MLQEGNQGGIRKGTKKVSGSGPGKGLYAVPERGGCGPGKRLNLVPEKGGCGPEKR